MARATVARALIGQPLISAQWLGGNRVIIDLMAPIPAGTKFPGHLRTERDQPGYTRLRVFAGDPYATAVLGKRGRAYNGPAIAQRVEVQHIDGQPDLPAARDAILALHRRWPKLWFYDRTGLDLQALFPPEPIAPPMTTDDDAWLRAAGNLDDI